VRSWLILIGLLATGCATVQRPALSVAAPPAAVLNHRGCPEIAEHRSAIRSPDPFLRSLLIEGCGLSPTLRALADAIGRTDGVVYITSETCPVRALRGCLLHKIQDTGNARYLWIRVNATAYADPTTLVGTMAHELQHALEVLERPDIRSQRDLLDLYQSVGSPALRSGASPFRAYETTAAIDVTEAVQAELRNGSG
jgi:hypothetical protein